MPSFFYTQPPYFIIKKSARTSCRTKASGRGSEAPGGRGLAAPERGGEGDDGNAVGSPVERRIRGRIDDLATADVDHGRAGTTDRGAGDEEDRPSQAELVEPLRPGVGPPVGGAEIGLVQVRPIALGVRGAHDRGDHADEERRDADPGGGDACVAERDRPRVRGDRGRPRRGDDRADRAYDPRTRAQRDGVGALGRGAARGVDVAVERTDRGEDRVPHLLGQAWERLSALKALELVERGLQEPHAAKCQRLAVDDHRVAPRELAGSLEQLAYRIAARESRGVRDRGGECEESRLGLSEKTPGLEEVRRLIGAEDHRARRVRRDPERTTLPEGERRPEHESRDCGHQYLGFHGSKIPFCRRQASRNERWSHFRDRPLKHISPELSSLEPKKTRQAGKMTKNL